MNPAYPLLTILTYSFLYLSVIFLWIPVFKKIPLWALILAVSTVCGLLGNRLEPISIVFILLLFMFTHYLQNQQSPGWARVLSALALFFLGGALEMHLLPGFHNLQVLDKVHISEHGIPFSLYLNFDKTLVGIVILGTLHSLITSQDEWRKMFKIMLPLACLVIFIIALLSFLFNFVSFDPKLPDSLLIWASTNLLLVCVAEEGFFRGFIQQYLSLLFDRIKYGDLLAILIASSLFGLAHYSGGGLYVILAMVAGMGYGFIYVRTKRIEASILTHFLLNLVHYLLFTYPALST